MPSSASFCIVAPQCSLPSAPLPKCACCQVTSRRFEPTLLETASSWSERNLCGTDVPEMWHFRINLCPEFSLKDCAGSRQKHCRSFCKRNRTFQPSVRRFQCIDSSFSCVNSSCPTPATRMSVMSSSGALQVVLSIDLLGFGCLCDCM